MASLQEKFKDLQLGIKFFFLPIIPMGTQTALLMSVKRTENMKTLNAIAVTVS